MPRMKRKVLVMISPVSTARMAILSIGNDMNGEKPPSHLSNTFRDSTGETPRRFRHETTS